MTKKELIRAIKDRLEDEVSPSAVAPVVNAVFDEILAAVRKGDRVKIQSFGTFYRKGIPPKKTRLFSGDRQIIDLPFRFKVGLSSSDKADEILMTRDEQSFLESMAELADGPRRGR